MSIKLEQKVLAHQFAIRATDSVDELLDDQASPSWSISHRQLFTRT